MDYLCVALGLADILKKFSIIDRTIIRSNLKNIETYCHVKIKNLSSLLDIVFEDNSNDILTVIDKFCLN